MNNLKPRVFVTQELPSLDYSPAEKFGDVVFVTHREMSIAKNSLANDALVREITVALRDFDPANDYIVFSGSPAVAAAVFLILGRKAVNRVRLLKWSNRDLSYNLINIEV